MGYLFKYPGGVYMEKNVTDKVLKNLNRVEGQVRGIGKMVEDDRYCIDIVTQIAAAKAALSRIESDLLRQHLGHCVHRAMNSKNATEQQKVIEELVGVFRRA
jgi:DNA-binding FrmR family transcriptional regulator